MHAGSIAGFQPSSINQTNFLDSKRQMPWQQHQKDPISQTEAVYVVAGNDAGLVHIWAGTRSGQHTWQPVAVMQQVCASPLSGMSSKTALHSQLDCTWSRMLLQQWIPV